MVVAEVLDKEVNKELVMDVVVKGVVDKESTKELVTEVNEGLVLV